MLSLCITRPSRFVLASVLISTSVLLAPNASADTLAQVIDDYWEYALREDPVRGTASGRNEFNDRLPGVTQEDQARRLGAERAFLARLDALDGSAMGEDDRINKELLSWILTDSISAYELDLSRIPFNTFSGFYMSALNASQGVAMRSVADFEAYIRRLREIPRYFEENVENMRRGVETDFTLPRIVIEGVLPTVQAQVYDSPESSSFFEPFAAMPDSIEPGERERLIAEGRRAISEAAIPAFKRVAEYLGEAYLEASRTSLGAEQAAGGKAYYIHQMRSYVTVENPDARLIHQTGLDEVRRIREEMDQIIAELEFDGDFDAFVAFLRSDPQFYAASEDELLKEAAYTAKRIDYVMPEFFGRLPRLPYGIVPVPAEVAPNYTTAAYVGAPIGGVRGGAYWVNTHALDQRPLYELTALTLHEAVPGHHHQNALAQELENVPAFRLNLYFSAFGEGWALYTEKLGVEMDVYRTPYEHFGRLSYEMWRACRLVIDTGIHAMGWSRDQALEFLASNTSLSEANVRAEVDRYISWPGQALSYKLGELKIWELRRHAERRLDSAFDLREFHDVVLGQGALPLAMLEAQVERYIGRREVD